MKLDVTNMRFLRRLLPVLVLLASLNFFLSPPASAQTSPSEYFQLSYNIGGLTPPPQVGANQSFTVTVTGQVNCIKDLPGWIGGFVTAVAVTGKITAQPAGGAAIVLNPGYTVTITDIPRTAGQSSNINQSLTLQFPAGSAPGSYNISGELLSAVAQPLGLDIRTVLALPASQSAGFVTLLAPPVTGAGGGGGGGAVTIPEATPPPAAPGPNINAFGEARPWAFNQDGTLAQEAKISSSDGKIAVFLKEGTSIRDSGGAKVENLSVSTETSPPQAAQGHSLVGSAVSLGPNGSKFQPPLELTLSYDDKLLPGNASEKDLFIAYWDAATGKWVPLPGEVDPVRKVVIVKVDHFTIFSIVGKVKLPASFSVSSLLVTPREAKVGEPVVISAEVTNKGESEGKYSASLTVDGVKVETRELTVPALTSQKVTFNITRYNPGNYGVSLGEQSVRFLVLPGSPAPAPESGAPEAPPSIPEPVISPEQPKAGEPVDSPPSPAAPAIAVPPPLLAISELVISPKEAKIGQRVDISAEISNEGGSEGSFDVPLIIDGAEAESKKVTLSALASRKVSFSISWDRPGSYRISLGGQTGAVTVLAPKRSIDFSPQPVIILAVAIAVAAGYVSWRLFRTRRSS